MQTPGDDDLDQVVAACRVVTSIVNGPLYRGGALGSLSLATSRLPASTPHVGSTLGGESLQARPELLCSSPRYWSRFSSG